MLQVRHTCWGGGGQGQYEEGKRQCSGDTDVVAGISLLASRGDRAREEHVRHDTRGSSPSGVCPTRRRDKGRGVTPDTVQQR